VQAKNVQFIVIWEGLNDMQQWFAENLDAPIEMPHTLEGERRIKYASLDRCQQAEERDDKETNNSLVICAQLHKAAQVLTHKGRLPPNEEL
jgi:hypothetical protein